jgi:hypothetical protein
MLLTENQLRRLIYLQLNENISIEDFLLNEGLFDNRNLIKTMKYLASTAVLVAGFQHHLNNYVPYLKFKNELIDLTPRETASKRSTKGQFTKEKFLNNYLNSVLRNLNIELQSESEEELKEKLTELILHINNNNIPKNVAKQVVTISSIRDEEDSKYPFIIVDDANRKLYLFNGDYTFKNFYPVITGGDKGDFDYYDFASWLRANNVKTDYDEAEKNNDKKTIGNYFNYFLMQRRDTKNNITPSGIYTIGNVEKFSDAKKNDPTHVNNYGTVGKISMRTGLKDAPKKRITTIAVHGTQKPVRVANLKNAKSQLEKNSKADIVQTLKSEPSFGCINLLDEDLEKLINDLNFTKEKANKIYIYIMSDETPDGVLEYGNLEKAISDEDYTKNYYASGALEALSFIAVGTAVDFNNEKFLEFIGKKKKSD